MRPDLSLKNKILFRMSQALHEKTLQTQEDEKIAKISIQNLIITKNSQNAGNDNNGDISSPEFAQTNLKSPEFPKVSEINMKVSSDFQPI